MIGGNKPAAWERREAAARESNSDRFWRFARYGIMLGVAAGLIAAALIFA